MCEAHATAGTQIQQVRTKVTEVNDPFMVTLLVQNSWCSATRLVTSSPCFQVPPSPVETHWRLNWSMSKTGVAIINGLYPWGFTGPRGYPSIHMYLGTGNAIKTNSRETAHGSPLITSWLCSLKCFLESVMPKKNRTTTPLHSAVVGTIPKRGSMRRSTLPALTAGANGPNSCGKWLQLFND